MELVGSRWRSELWYHSNCQTYFQPHHTLDLVIWMDLTHGCWETWGSCLQEPCQWCYNHIQGRQQSSRIWLYIFWTDIPQHETELLFIWTVSDFICDYSEVDGILDSLNNLSHNCASQNVQDLILDTRGSVCGISAGLSKVISQHCISSCYTKL